VSIDELRGIVDAALAELKKLEELARLRLKIAFLRQDVEELEEKVSDVKETLSDIENTMNDIEDMIKKTVSKLRDEEAEEK